MKFKVTWLDWDYKEHRTTVELGHDERLDPSHLRLGMRRRDRSHCRTILEWERI